MQKFLNANNVPLSAAVFLATDHYDRVPGTISATSLLKPIRQVVLQGRVPPEQAAIDVTQVVKSRIGTSIHDGIEKAWAGGHYKDAMRALGYPESLIERIVVNPEGDIPDNAIPVYMELRTTREINGQKITGKFDFVAEGRVEDFKSTSVYTWINDNKTKDYQYQGSIYRWLNPEIITQDHMAIQFFFTDWSAAQLKSNQVYPPAPVVTKTIPLLDLDQTEAFITERLALFDQYKDRPEEHLPLCTDEELWRKAPVYKYYKNPANKTRSTKNFDDPGEAYDRLAKDGNVGEVIAVPGQVTACKFCPAFSVCSQKDALIADGSLVL